MTPVGAGPMGRAAVALAVGVGAACCGLLSPLPVNAQQLAQAGSEGGSLGGGIPPAYRTSRPRVQPRAQHERRPSPGLARRPDDGLAKFDGTWSVSSGGGCPAAGNGEVRIAHGHIIAANGSGRVGPDGAVDTVTTVAGMTVVGRGRIVGHAASGTYRQSNGCGGPWSAVRL